MSSSLQIIFVALFWTRFNSSMSFLCWEFQSWTQGSRVECRTPGGTSPERSRGAESPPSNCYPCCCGCSPGYSWHSGLGVHIARSCPAFHPSVTRSPSCQGSSQSLHLPACIDSGGCPDTSTGPCTCHCWTSWASHRPTSPACPGLFGRYPILLACNN